MPLSRTIFPDQNSLNKIKVEKRLLKINESETKFAARMKDSNAYTRYKSINLCLTNFQNVSTFFFK